MFKTSMLIATIFTTGSIYVFLELMYELFKIKKIYKSLNDYTILLKCSINKTLLIISVILTCGFILSFNNMIKHENFITPKILFEYNIIFGLVLMFVLWLFTLSTIFVTNKGVLNVSLSKLIIEILIWQEVYKYNLDGKYIILYYKRKNNNKKMKIRVPDELDRTKVIALIKNNVASSVVENANK